METTKRGRPTSKPRLIHLYNDDVAAVAVQAIVDHVVEMHGMLGAPNVALLAPLGIDRLLHGEAVSPRELSRKTLLGDRIRLVVHYAQTGDTDREGVGAIRAAIDLICGAMYGQPGVPGHPTGEETVDDIDGETPLGTALLAALARVHLARRDGVTPRELACLCGVVREHVYALVRKGEFKLVNGLVPRQDAERFAILRGVPSFGRSGYYVTGSDDGGAIGMGFFAHITDAQAAAVRYSLQPDRLVFAVSPADGDGEALCIAQDGVLKHPKTGEPIEIEP